MENRNSSEQGILDLKGLSRLEPELTQVNQHIERLFRSQNPSMQKILQWVLQARGKQLRPILTLLCAKLAGKQVDAVDSEILRGSGPRPECIPKFRGKTLLETDCGKRSRRGGAPDG